MDKMTVEMSRTRNRVAHSFSTAIRTGGTALAVLLVKFVLGSVFTATHIQAATDYIDPVGGTLYATSVGGPQLNGSATPGYRYGLPVTSAYTNTSPTGYYWIETSWGVHPTYATNVVYSVNGAICRTVNQSNNVAGAAASAKWSGFKALNNGGFSILSLTNGISQITSDASGGGGDHTRGLWRTTRLTGSWIIPSSFGLVAVASNSPGFCNYYYTSSSSNSFAIGSKLAPGVYKLEVSWGVHSAHCSAVTYSYNQTGAGGFAGATPILTGVNQRGMNDGRTFEGYFSFFNTWSGLRDLGTFTVEAGSQIWLSGTGGALTMGVLQATPVGSATYIDPPDSTTYTNAAICGPASNGGAVQKYTYDTIPSSSWISHNTNGNYWVEVSWGTYTTYNTSVAYSVDGTTYLTAVNQTKTVVGTAGSGIWSGFRALNPSGTTGIALASGVSAISATANGTGFLSRGIWRVSPLTGTLINPVAFGSTNSTSSSPGNGNYYYTPSLSITSNSFAIGSALAPGYYRLEVSWGVHPSHSSAVTYSYNRTGVGGFAGATPVLAGVNQRGMNDGRTFIRPAISGLETWSGFKTLGNFRVEAGSQIWLSGVGGALTMGVIQATPTDPPPPSGTLVRVL